jgi:hypothetical protein
MGECLKCGYKTPTGFDYYREKVTGKCLCEEYYSGVDHELMEAFCVEIAPITAGYDEVDYEEDYVDDYEG